MSLAEIIEELPKLTAEERQAIYRQIEELDGEPQFEVACDFPRYLPHWSGMAPSRSPPEMSRHSVTPNIVEKQDAK